MSKPPAAANPAKPVSEVLPSTMSLMCTSQASNPARSNAAPISTCPFTPCSRRMATRGRAPACTKGEIGRAHV